MTCAILRLLGAVGVGFFLTSPLFAADEFINNNEVAISDKDKDTVESFAVATSESQFVAAAKERGVAVVDEINSAQDIKGLKEGDDVALIIKNPAKKDDFVWVFISNVASDAIAALPKAVLIGSGLIFAAGGGAVAGTVAMAVVGQAAVVPAIGAIQAGSVIGANLALIGAPIAAGVVGGAAGAAAGGAVGYYAIGKIINAAGSMALRVLTAPVNYLQSVYERSK